MQENDIFKVCPLCNVKWKTRDDFIDDQILELIGYQAHFKRLEQSLFYFNHNSDNCGSTLAIEAYRFFGLYSGKKYKERRTGLNDCPGYCLDKDQLDRCTALCECAFNREICHLINKRKALKYTS